jgi:hypothetical protein
MVPSDTAWDQIQAQYSSAFKVSKDWRTPTWCPATQPGTRFRPSTPVHSRLVRTGEHLHDARNTARDQIQAQYFSAFKVSNSGYTDIKKENKIFLKYKAIQNRADAKS